MVEKRKSFEYVFHWYFYSKSMVSAFEKLKKLAIFSGSSVSDVLESLMLSYNEENYDKILGNLNIVSENEMIEACRSAGHKTTKRSLMLYRQKDVLKDSNGSRFWYTDGFNIFYDKDKTLEFIKSRKDNPMSRLSVEKESIENGMEQGASGIS